MLVRCHAEGREDEWEAICLDFDIAVQGRSFDDAVSQLKSAIVSYLEYVETLPKSERAHFLRRRAPLSVRIKFAWHALLTSLFRRDGSESDKTRGQFTLACQA